MTSASHEESGPIAREVVEQITRQAVVPLDERDLPALLEASETLRDDDTCLAGRIRVLSLQGHVMVQEQTQQGQILVRRLGSREAAEGFVDDRLATYERMWDGCGCKVDYSPQPEDD